MYDLFTNLNADVSRRLEANAMASFAEICGKDVYDLISDEVDPTKRPSLKVTFSVVSCTGGIFIHFMS